MRDPHVNSLRYNVSPEEGISYSDPEPLSFANHLGTFELSNNTLVVFPVEHFSIEDDARRALDPFLQAWEIETDLSSRVGMIRFKYDRAEMIDRDPPPPGSPKKINVTGKATISVVGCRSSALITSNKYPPPPDTFCVTPAVQFAYRRWVGYCAGNEPLQAMAYFVYTHLVSIAGDNRRAGKLFRIDISVIKKISELSSTKGSELTARKAPKNKQFQDLSGAEQVWLEEATRRVIRRLGEYASGAPLIPISMADLPKM